MRFVFRNNTIERFFTKEYVFSGYDDISVVPEDAESYVWWYELPVKYAQDVLASEITGYTQKFGFVLQRIDPKKTVVALTMDILYNVPFADDDYRVIQAVDTYNACLYDAARQYSNLKVICLHEFTRQYAASELIDWKFYFLSQMGMNPRLSKPFKLWWQRKMEGVAMQRKKCLVLDLDNTLWGGVLGEDGIDGIQIGGDYPGKAFHYWQAALLELSKNGVILAVCSKNNEQDVLAVWEKHPFMLLDGKSFSAYRINWKDKATNIKELAEELNIGLDSFVFIDDNPTERELVKQMLPMVSVPDFPEHPYMLPMFFKQLVADYFKVYSITNEDRQKTEQYRANASRIQAQKGFADFDQFLESLAIQITIEEANEFNIQRIAQMTQKTNQFNLTTKRYTDADVRACLEAGWKIWCMRVTDKFGDNGITGCIMVNGDTVDSFLLSCRILGKGIEFAFINTIFGMLRRQGVSMLHAMYIPTLKNAQVSDFYERCGMTCVSEDTNGNKTYTINLKATDFQIKDYYHVVIKNE